MLIITGVIVADSACRAVVGFVNSMAVLIGATFAPVLNLTVTNSTTMAFVLPPLNVTQYQSLFITYNNMTLTFTDLFYYTNDCPTPGKRLCVLRRLLKA